MASVAERILSERVGEHVEAGETVYVEPDVIMLHDGSGATALRTLRELGVERVESPEKVVLIFDHSVPPSSVEAANRQNELLEFARRHGIEHVHVDEGVCHQVLVEEGYAGPGRVIFGGDSHTPTAGAVSALAFGFGGTDMAFALLYGELWIRVPRTVRVHVEGELREPTTAKDLALTVVGELGAGYADYAVLEYTGFPERMPLSDRMCLCNLATEAGAKSAYVPPEMGPEELRPGDADEVIELDASEVEPVVSVPYRVDDVRPVGDVQGVEVTRVFVGSCTNGRYRDVKIFTEILEELDGPHPNVRIVVVPASRRVFERMTETGITLKLIRMGVTIAPPGCGPCLGEHLGVLGDDDICVSTANRNFPGRMGSRGAEIYLASPVTAAVAAAEGELVDPKDILR
ncbi:3-isopropylmalate dehydratase/homoaconitate hydratase family large subunit [Methanopyrus sp. KOL6]|uniref:3-isopropylmalate dehydratase/homoaconitate hydratase family large subunit n=1 Tax=Methanopyrus sp. KOL6 TaxID=1937004 RepID=UPI001E5216B8|nr:3-isopropylmalate dehydratase/homoaconitate hydratase family large subunit [Methanopyrus sp. KOL6]